MSARLDATPSPRGQWYHDGGSIELSKYSELKADPPEFIHRRFSVTGRFYPSFQPEVIL
jgi:hypothetical protein